MRTLKQSSNKLQSWPQAGPNGSLSLDAPAAMFLADSVTKSFGAFQALGPFSLSIRHGETVAIVGPSGSGKTTLLHLFAGLTSPTDGSIRINGYDPAELGRGRQLARLVGIIAQQSDLVLNLG